MLLPETLDESCPQTVSVKEVYFVVFVAFVADSEREHR